MGPNENLPFGAIEHLCNRIEAQGKIEPVDIALKLSPTPAVCGWPKEKAYMTIVTAERHKRSCYGAFIGLWIRRPAGYMSISAAARLKSALIRMNTGTCFLQAEA